VLSLIGFSLRSRSFRSQKAIARNVNLEREQLGMKVAGNQAWNLPDNWANTCQVIKEVMYEREDLDLFYKRKYFIYIYDRMRRSSYNLVLDGIVKNTEENRKLKMCIQKEAKMKERLLQEKCEKQEKMREKVELEKRWSEMNKKNEELWKQEQKSNEKKWLTGLVKSTKRQQELEGFWEEQEKQFLATIGEEIASMEKVLCTRLSVTDISISFYPFAGTED
jgi:hypothetical protein